MRYTGLTLCGARSNKPIPRQGIHICIVHRKKSQSFGSVQFWASCISSFLRGHESSPTLCRGGVDWIDDKSTKTAPIIRRLPITHHRCVPSYLVSVDDVLLASLEFPSACPIRILHQPRTTRGRAGRWAETLRFGWVLLWIQFARFVTIA